MSVPRTLIVDDNPVNAELAQRVMTHLGHRADAVFSGEEALKSFAPGKYQLILMDCHMPGLDGFQTTVALREREAAAAVVERAWIIALTAAEESLSRPRCLESGMDDFLAKPIATGPLRLAVERGLPERFRSSDPGAFDPAVLEELRGADAPAGQPKPLEAILDHFLSETPPLLHRFSAAVMEKDRPGAQSTGRLLAASCGNLGARRAIRLCAEVQRMTAATPQKLRLLNREFEMLFCRLRRMREHTPPARPKAGAC